MKNHVLDARTAFLPFYLDWGLFSFYENIHERCQKLAWDLNLSPLQDTS